MPSTEAGNLRKLFASLRFRVGAAFFVLLFTTMVIINYYPLTLVRSQMISAKEDSMLVSARTLASALESFATLSGENVYSAVRLLESMREGRVLVTDDKQVAIYDSYTSTGTVGRQVFFSEISTCLTGLDVFRCRYTDTLFESMVAVPVLQGNKIVAAVYLYEYDVESASLLRQTRSELAQLSTSIAVVCAIALIAFLFVFSRRLGLLLRSVRQIGRGHDDQQIDLGGVHELLIIGAEFNALTAQIRKNEERRLQFVTDASNGLKTHLA